MVNTHIARVVRQLLVLIALVVAIAPAAQVFAHRVIGRAYPTLVTALVQSPTASPSDLPIPIFDTGLSVVCIRVTNTSRVETRITAVGLELPGTLAGFALVSPLDAGLSIQENVGGIPGFPGVALDVAVVTGGGFTGGRPRLGLPPSATPTVICLSGPFDPKVPIETALNGVFVRFDSGDPLSTASDIGVWERR
jgi:hypothetical protein